MIVNRYWIVLEYFGRVPCVMVFVRRGMNFKLLFFYFFPHFSQVLFRLGADREFVVKILFLWLFWLKKWMFLFLIFHRHLGVFIYLIPFYLFGVLILQRIDFFRAKLLWNCVRKLKKKKKIGSFSSKNVQSLTSWKTLRNMSRNVESQDEKKDTEIPNIRKIEWQNKEKKNSTFILFHPRLNKQTSQRK